MWNIDPNNNNKYMIIKRRLLGEGTSERGKGKGEGYGEKYYQSILHIHISMKIV
jgi:hypothetical protein